MTLTDFNDMSNERAIRERVNAAVPAESSVSFGNPGSWPILADEALSGLAGEIVHAATENSEADPAAVLATLLTHFGVVVGRGPFFRLSDTRHHARLFTALVGQTARGRKGTSEAPIRRLWEVASEECGSLNWRPGPMSTGEGLVQPIRDGEEEEGGDPGNPDKRLLIVEGEFGAPLQTMQRQGNTLSTYLRNAWDGRDLEPLTKSKRIKATEPHIGIVGHITLPELQKLLPQTEMFNGFANRFLWFAVKRHKILPLASGMAKSAVDQLGRKYADGIRLARRLEEIEFSDDARKNYNTIYPQLTEDREGLFGVAMARAEVQVIRLALTYALLDAAPLITTKHLTSAIAVWDYCDASAEHIFRDAAVNNLPNRVLKVLAAGELTTTGLHNALGRHIRKDVLQPVLNRLEQQGRIESLTEATAGRPRQTWRLRNPSGLSAN